MKNIDNLSNKTKVDLDEFERQELNDLEKQSIKNTIKTKKQKKVWKKVVGTVVAASLAIGLFFQTGTGKEVYAAAKEFLLDKYNIAFNTGYNGDKDLTELVEKTSITKEFDDYNIELRYSVRDGNKAFYKMLIHYKKDIDYENGRLRLSNNENDEDITYDDDFAYGLNIDGKKIETESGGALPQLIDKKNNIFQLDLEEDYGKDISKLIKKDSKIEFNITGFAFEFDDKDILIEDKISFDITNTFKDMAYLNKKYEIVGDKKFIDEKTGINFEVKDIKLNPLTQTIEIGYKNDNNETMTQSDSRLEIIGVTNEGKQFMISSRSNLNDDTKGTLEFVNYDNTMNPENIEQNRSVQELYKELTADDFYKEKVSVNLDYLGDKFTGESSFKDMLSAKEIKIIILFEEQGLEITKNENGEKYYNQTGLIEMRNLGEFTIKLK